MLGYDPGTQAGQLRPLIGSQLQDSGLPDRLRVIEALRLFGTSAARDGDELLERFGLADRRRSAFSSLSGGERQRLFLVLALLNRPRLVILDELTQGLDPGARRNVWAAVRRLHEAGTTVLLVTHEVDEAEALCDRVVVMRAGRVIDSGTPAALVRRYGRTAVVRFTLPALVAAKVAGEPTALLDEPTALLDEPTALLDQPTALLDEPTALLDELRRLDGVRSLVVDGADVTVQGDRRMIAHVGASLVRHRMVPDDLDVHVPSLEDAVLTLLEPSADDGDLGRVDGAIAARGELVGGRR